MIDQAKLDQGGYAGLNLAQGKPASLCELVGGKPALLSQVLKDLLSTLVSSAVGIRGAYALQETRRKCLRQQGNIIVRGPGRESALRTGGFVWSSSIPP